MTERLSIPVITDPHELRGAVQQIPENPSMAIVAKMPNLKEFVTAIYGNDTERLMAQSITRPKDGIGAHWDIHNPHIDQQYPFVATYNRRGRAMLQTTILRELLARDYEQRHPEPTSEARTARRLYSNFVLATTDTIHEAEIGPGIGLVFPQLNQPDVMPLVHSITPERSASEHRAEFVKLAMPTDTNAAREVHLSEGYQLYGDFMRDEEMKLEELLETINDLGGVEEIRAALERQQPVPSRRMGDAQDSTL